MVLDLHKVWPSISVVMWKSQHDMNAHMSRRVNTVCSPDSCSLLTLQAGFARYGHVGVLV